MIVAVVCAGTRVNCIHVITIVHMVYGSHSFQRHPKFRELTSLTDLATIIYNPKDPYEAP